MFPLSKNNETTATDNVNFNYCIIFSYLTVNEVSETIGMKISRILFVLVCIGQS